MSSAELFVIACEYVSGFECVCVHRYYNIPYLLFLLNLNLKFNSRQSQIGTRPLPKCHQQFITSCPTGLFKKKNIQTKRRKKKKTTNHFLTMFILILCTHPRLVSIYSDNNRRFVKMMNDTVQQSRCPLYSKFLYK